MLLAVPSTAPLLGTSKLSACPILIYKPIITDLQ